MDPQSGISSEWQTKLVFNFVPFDSLPKIVPFYSKSMHFIHRSRASGLRPAHISRPTAENDRRAAKLVYGKEWQLFEYSLKEECRLNIFNVYNHRFLRAIRCEMSSKGDRCGLHDVA